MTTILLAILLMIVVFAAMAIGIIFGRAPIKGSCGGMSAMTGDACEVCGGNPAKCDEVSRRPPGQTGDGTGGGAVRSFDPRRDAGDREA